VATCSGALAAKNLPRYCPDAPRKGPCKVAERLGQEVRQLGFSHEGQPYSVTVSQGLASLSAEDATLDSLFARADAAMYEAKRQGKNRVIAG
jgi:diguanylate cyclase (GGDEF)-like protein